MQGTVQWNCTASHQGWRISCPSSHLEHERSLLTLYIRHRKSPERESKGASKAVRRLYSTLIYLDMQKLRV